MIDDVTEERNKGEGEGEEEEWLTFDVICSAKVAALDRQKSYFSPEWTAQEAERLLNEWRKWE